MALLRLSCAFWLLAAALLAIGCTPATSIPMDTVYFNPAGPDQNSILIVFLPGRWNSAANFAEEGFVAAVRRSGIPADMMAAEAHMGYYLARTFPERLHEDVIVPAKNKGYRQIWLVGISIGGLGALWYDGTYSGELAGLVVLAPYLGEPEIYGEVARSGGVAKWDPSPIAADDWQRKLWFNLKTFEAREKSLDRLYLGYGLQDRFAVPDGMLAKVLPGEQVFTAEGGHDWATWRRLLEEMLKKSVLAQKSGVAGK
jgi:pimeloyl-ACP methyl ester carboxylesterase